MSLHLTHRHPPPPQTTPMPTKPVPVRPPPLPPSNRLLLQTGCPAGPSTGVVVRDSVLADLPESGFSQVPSPNRLKLDYFRAVSSETMAAGESNKSGNDGKGTEKGLECSNQGCRRVSLKPIGNGWLYRSAVAKLHKLISINDLKGQLKGMGLDNIEIRALGGRSVILTCPSKDEMENMIKERCLQRWFSEIIPWDGQAACTERFVWLCCYGIPLNVWNNMSFKSIGELWDSFISIDEATLKMSSFAEAKILITTNIFKEIDEWIIIEVDGKSYKVKVMEESCDQPHDAENQIPRASLTSSSNPDEESKDAMEDSEDEVERLMSDEALGDVEKDVDLGSESNDISSISTHGLYSIVEDSMGLPALFQEVEDSGVKNQGDKIVSHSALVVTDPMILSNEGKEPWVEPIVFESGNNIRASQIEGINLMVDFWPTEVIEKNRGQLFGKGLVSNELSRSSVPSQDISGYIADTPDQEQHRIAEEFQETIKTGTKLGIKYNDAGIMRMKKLIEQEVKDMEFIMRDNRFAPLQRNKLQRNEPWARQSPSLAF